MSPYLVAFLAMLGGAAIVLLATVLPAALRVRRLLRRIAALERHPTMVAMRDVRDVQAKLDPVRSCLDAIRGRSDQIGADIAAIMESSASLRLQVGRVSFATVLLLQTFVPTLRGSMSDS
jgi:hypothetical protein